MDDRKHPVVMRFEGMHPSRIGGYEAHRTRRGGDLGHVDKSRSKLNQPLIGETDWAARAVAEIAAMRAENFADELEALSRRKRRKEIERRMVEGPRDPWRPSKHGPMREVILTANKEWFEADPTAPDEVSDFFGEADRGKREVEFEKRAVAWLKIHFGDDVIHARADRDEAAYHIHAVILPRATVETKDKTTGETTATRRMLQPSIHPMIKDYEVAQDSVGAWFSELGLVRGERRAEAIRKARAAGAEPPPKRRHARTSTWRAQQELKLQERGKTLDSREVALERRDEALTGREAEADAVVAAAEGLAEGLIEIDASGPEVRLKGVEEGSGSPAPEPILERLERSPKGCARAAGAFATIQDRLAEQARSEAEEHLAHEVAELRAADDAIVEIARQSPEELRGRIVEARRSLFPKLIGLERAIGGASGQGRKLPRRGPGEENIE